AVNTQTTVQKYSVGASVISGPNGLSKAEFLECVRRSNQACQQGEYALANCILYSNRSAAYLRQGQYNTALDDAIKARLINPKWPKVGGLTPEL
uniref:Tetratricopeptide repeat domain 28 n=1 Tax=Anabas testudineus TaxID=64144 RepID=A0A3Q1HDI7_ANATE